MSDDKVPPAPEPTVDKNPDLGKEVGGADAVDDRVTVPPLSAEPPSSAQSDQDEVPEEIQQPEGPDSEANLDDPSAEPPG